MWQNICSQICVPFVWAFSLNKDSEAVDVLNMNTTTWLMLNLLTMRIFF